MIRLRDWQHCVVCAPGHRSDWLACRSLSGLASCTAKIAETVKYAETFDVGSSSLLVPSVAVCCAEGRSMQCFTAQEGDDWFDEGSCSFLVPSAAVFSAAGMGLQYPAATLACVIAGDDATALVVAFASAALLRVIWPVMDRGGTFCQALFGTCNFATCVIGTLQRIESHIEFGNFSVLHLRMEPFSGSAAAAICANHCYWLRTV